MSLRGARVAILVEDFYQDQEVWYPFYRLKEAGAEVVTVGTGRKSEFKGKYGIPLLAQTTAAQVSAAEFDAVIVPGGYAPDLLRRYDAVLRLVRETDAQGKIVAAICHAGWVLVSAGILKGRTMTCFAAIKDDVVNAGAKYLDREVVIDGNLITSRTPEDLPMFAAAIVDALQARRAGGRPAAPARTAAPRASKR